MGRVPKGHEFLHHINVEQLKNIYKKEHNAKAKIRLQACILRKEGKTLSAIADKVHYPLTTVGDWLRRIHDKGLGRRYSVKNSGRPARLTKEQKKDLIQALDESPEKRGLPFKMWTTKLLAYFIAETYKVIYKIRRVERLVHGLGFNFKKPRQQHKFANKKLQALFKKNFERTLGHTWTLDGRSYSLTRVSSK